MDVNWVNPKTEARLTPGKGTGNFATELINAGETVAGFGGYVKTRLEIRSLSADQQHRSIQIDDDLYLVSDIHPEPGDFFNHSCDPNCVLISSQILVAWRDIAVGEELTFDYATSDSSDYDEFTCECAKPTCRGIVSGQDWRLPEVQKKYEGYFSPYLARRIAREQAHSIL